ncbi:MAG: prohead protease/major capsid protein fusion protein, partial [Planctomycetota bacterium]
GAASIEMRVVPSTFNEAERTFEITFSTGAAVRRYSWRYGAYDELLSLDPAHVRLERLNSGRAPFLKDHRQHTVDAVIGSIVEGSVRMEGGRMVGFVQMHETEEAQALMERMVRGELPSVSLGYQTYEHTVIERDDNVDERTATDWEPYELSLVSIPADNDSHTRDHQQGAECVLRGTTRTIMAGTNGKKEPAPKEGAREGAPKDSTSDEEKRSATATAVEDPPEPDPRQRGAEPVDADEVREQARREEKARAKEIRLHAKRAGLSGDFVDKLVDGDKSVLDAREAILEEWARTNEGPEISSTGGASVGTEEQSKVRQAMEDALLNRHNPTKYKLKDGDDARHFAGDSLYELGKRYVERMGQKLPEVGTKMVRAGLILGYRMGGMHVSSDFPLVLANVAGKTLRDEYREAPRAHEALVRPRAVADFKSISVTKLGATSELQEVPEGGEYPRATLDETGENYKLAKYGTVIPITREALINDDLDAFTRIPGKMGRKARKLESDLFFAILTQNPVMADGLPLFHVDHGNLITSPLDQAGLEAANLAMRLQSEDDGTPIELMPRFLLTPVAQQVNAQRLVVLQTVPTKSEDTNPFQQNLDLISTP